MSVYTISLYSSASMIIVMNIDSVYAVGDQVSNFVLYTRCGCPSTQPLPLISLLRFFEEHEVTEGR